MVLVGDRYENLWDLCTCIHWCFKSKYIEGKRSHTCMSNKPIYGLVGLLMHTHPIQWCFKYKCIKGKRSHTYIHVRRTFDSRTFICVLYIMLHVAQFERGSYAPDCVRTYIHVRRTFDSRTYRCVLYIMLHVAQFDRGSYAPDCIHTCMSHI